VSSSPWAPIVSTWSLDCLGKLSTKWFSKFCGKQSPNSTQLLHEKMPAWLGCSAARVLLDLAEDCLAAKLMDSKVDTKMENTVDYMMMSDTESCVAALLETSVKHTPHFDWVVSHIGSCFTHRVLSVGLKDYFTASKEGVGELSLTKVPRLLSVVNILSHLATAHQTYLQTTVHSMLSSILTTTPPSSTHSAAVPFLLSLSTSSPGVRRALTSNLTPLLTPGFLSLTLPGQACTSPLLMHSYPMLLNSYSQQTVKDLTYSCCCSGLVLVRGMWHQPPGPS
jgi:integrator complex subunit 5